MSHVCTPTVFVHGHFQCSSCGRVLVDCCEGAPSEGPVARLVNRIQGLQRQREEEDEEVRELLEDLRRAANGDQFTLEGVRFHIGDNFLHEGATSVESTDRCNS